jgi:arylsulfatase A-like enzyme
MGLVHRGWALVPPWMPDIPEIREDLADFYGCVAFLDRQFGRLLDALDETDLSERTIVLYTTDHGELRNLIADASGSPQLAELRAALDRHLEATEDPFRFFRNDLPLPPKTYETVRNWQPSG